MTAWHALQLVLAALALLALARSAREIALRAPSDGDALSTAVSTALASKQHALAVSIAEACAPAWASSVVLAGLEAAAEGDALDRAGRAMQAMEERASELTTNAIDRLRTLIALGRIASPLSFLAIALELAAAFGGDHGLLALQRGLVESIAIGRALLSFGIGFGTAGACMAAASLLRARLQAERTALTRIIARIAAPLAQPPHM